MKEKNYCSKRYECKTIFNGRKKCNAFEEGRKDDKPCENFEAL